MIWREWYSTTASEYPLLPSHVFALRKRKQKYMTSYKKITGFYKSRVKYVYNVVSRDKNISVVDTLPFKTDIPNSRKSMCIFPFFCGATA
jgi:hypothetical protein